MHSNMIRPWTLLAPALIAVTGLLLLPLVFIVQYSLWWSPSPGVVVQEMDLTNWAVVLTDPFYLTIFSETLLIAVFTTLICALIGYGPAYYIAMARSRFRYLLLALLIVPFWISYIIRTMSWINVLGSSGAVNKILLSLGVISEPLQMLYNEASVIVGLVHFLLPFMILNVFVSLETIDHDLLGAARSLGASGWHTFWQVTFPLSLGGLAAGALLCFVLTAGTYITPLILGGATDVLFANLIFEAVVMQLDWPLGSVMALLLLAALSLVVVLYSRLFSIGQLARSVGR